jgi:hypothetical protein
MGHTCNPSYSGGRDQEEHISKSAHAISSRDPISKKPITIKVKGGVGGVAQDVDPEFKPQYHQKKKANSSSIKSSLTNLKKESPPLAPQEKKEDW